MKNDKNAKMPKWFHGRVYSKGGVVNIKDGQATLRLDAHALSIYHLIQGYKVLGKNDDINLLKGIDWLRANYPHESDILFPIDKQLSSFNKRMNSSINKSRKNNYDLFGNKY